MYYENTDIDYAEIEEHVRNGMGFYGTCAGAFAVSAITNCSGTIWPSSIVLAEHVEAYCNGYAGEVGVKITTDGETILGESGIITMNEFYGPQFVGGERILATYTGDVTQHQGNTPAKKPTKNAGAIVTDTYGAGHIILSGPHPELNKRHVQDCNIVARLAAYAGGFFDVEAPASA